MSDPVASPTSSPCGVATWSMLPHSSKMRWGALGLSMALLLGSTACDEVFTSCNETLDCPDATGGMDFGGADGAGEAGAGGDGAGNAPSGAGGTRPTGGSGGRSSQDSAGGTSGSGGGEAIEPKVVLTLARSRVVVAPGREVVVSLDVEREHFDGPVALEIEGLPTAVASERVRIAADEQSGALVIRASPSALPEEIHRVEVRLNALGGALEHRVPFELVVAGHSGTIDSTFGEAGFVLLGEATPAGLALDAEGRVLVGSMEGLGGATRVRVVRVLDDGSIDASFARHSLAGGSQMSSILAWGEEVLLSVAVGDLPFLRRLLDDGSPDHSFGTGGDVVLPAFPLVTSLLDDGSAWTEGKSEGAVVDATIVSRSGTPKSVKFSSQNFRNVVILDRQGRYLVGDYQVPRGVLRFLPDGRRDALFGVSGSASLPTEGIVAGITVTDDGSILIVGNGDGERPLELVRLSDTGALDTRFGESGVAHAAIASKTTGPESLNLFAPLVVDSGDILVPSYSMDGSIELTRFKESGVLDFLVGDSGTLRLDELSEGRARSQEESALAATRFWLDRTGFRLLVLTPLENGQLALTRLWLY